ncbi:SPOC domain-containing protein 1 isoform X7 [Ornithorhynchus anatinus]|uniref:SPOC domain-containing protein 1 isoform X7 n=1 Tax=Ornithorhynchus anatinus TaxID=9258 RepID=UPI0019D471B9|nr:SPOC domain-containing protein 1 isoform X7 [Ornithorhynchus anatinus]
MSSGQAGAPKKGRGPSADPGREEGPTGRPSASDGAVGAKGRAASGRSRGREGGRESLGERAAEAGKSSLPGTAFPGELSAAGRMAEDLRGASDGKRTETIEMETCLTVVRPQDKRKGQNAEPAAVGTEKKTEFLEKLHFVLHDALFETCSKKLKAKSEKDSSETVEESSQTEGPPAVEGSQNEEISRGPSQTDAAQGDPPANMRGFEDRMDFPDSLSDLCEQGVFSRFAIVEDEPLASASNLPEGRKETERPERQQLASIRAEDGEEKSGKALASMKTKASKKRSEERSKKEEEGSGTREETESANDLNQSFGDLDCDVDNLFSPGPFLDNYLFSEKDAEEERHQSISDADKEEERTLVHQANGVKMMYYAAEEGRKKSRGRKDLAEDKKESEVTPSDPREKRKPSKPLKAPNPAKKPKSSVKPPTKPKKKNNSHPQKENSNPTTTSDHMGEKVRMTVQESLSRVLVKRKEEAPDLTMSEEAVADIATNIEVALFNLGHNTGNHYKNKYRSLFFNLNDKKNKDLFHQVIQGEITPEDLVRKSVTELASQELTEWRNQKMKHDLEIIEKEQREAPIRRITKITHKGEIEIQSDNDQDLTLEHLSEPVVYVDRKLRPQPVLQGDRTEQHEKHFLDPSCRICTGWQAPRGERGFNPPQMIPPSRPNTVNTSKSTITDQLAQVGPPDAEPTKTDQGQRTEPPDSLEPSAAPGNEPGGLKPKLPQWTTLWEGAFKMFCIEQFGAKIYLVSGSGSQLIQKLPAVVRSSGFILPKVAWENLDRIWPTEAQNICLVRIAPQGSHSFKYGRLLYSFLSEKQCFGVVDSEELDMYIMPLPASQQVPFKLYPLRGPVLEAMNYSLLLGLILPKSPLNEPGTTSPPADTPEMTPDMVTVEEQTEMKCYSPPRKRLKSPVAGKTSEPLPPEAPGTGQPAPSEESGPRDPQASALEEQLRNDVREGGDSDLGPPSHGVSSHQGASANPSLPSSPESTDAGLGGKPGLPGLSFYPRSQSSHWPVGPLGGPAPKEDPGGHLGAGCEERVRLSGERGASGLNPPGLQSLHPRPLELSSFYCVNHGAAQPSPHASLAAPQHPTPPSFQSHLPLGSMSCHQSAFNLVCHLENLVKMSNQIKASLQPVQASLQPDQASLQPDVASLQSEVASLQRVALRLASVNRAAPDPASLKQVVLDLASLDGAVPDPASLQLDAASLQWVALDPASLRRLALDPSSLQRMALDRASLKQAVLDPASLQRMPPNQVSLQRMTLDQSSLQQAVPDSAWMVPNPISLQPKAPDPVSVQQVVPDKASLRRAVPNPTRMVPNPVLPRMAPDPISPQ